MNLQRCAKCQKRPAMVFITRFENGKNINEGLCLVCANEMGIKPVNDILKRMGVDEGDIEAMYRFAELYYEDHDERYYPMIFKWVSILAAQKKDPAVWLLMGDLYNFASGTVRDAKRALSCYEQALSADIASGKNTDLTQEAHNYLEKQIIELRKEVFH